MSSRFSSGGSSGRRAIFNEINITPLTDIFLVLLIIMMVIAPMLDSKGLKLAVPTVGASSAVTQDPKIINLKVSAAGAYTVEDQEVTAEGLQKRLFELKPQNPEGLVIETAGDTKHGAMVVALDAARGAGIDKIAVSQAPDSGQ